MHSVSMASLALFAVVGLATGARAQDVHKCIQDGRVTYQATACPGDDRILPIQAGPGAEDVEAARQRAARQKARARVAGPAASGPEGDASGPARRRERPADAPV